ncbi:peroxisome biogenesis protein 1-like isoform X3 [Agrilus planipennis]|nr:peroxisome biogenesis protein 1-like isoform X3 [Agrilus planipennis]
MCIVNNVSAVKSLTLSATCADDYEVLELLAESVQNTLLNHVTVVNKNQKVIIWVSPFLHVNVNIDEVRPTSPGHLENLTEVIIKPPTKVKTDITEHNNMSVFDMFQSRVPLTNSEYVFNKFSKEIEPQVFRLHPLDDLKKVFGEIPNSDQYFNVFIRQKDLSGLLRKTASGKVDKLFLLKVIVPPYVSVQGFIAENLQVETVRVQLIVIQDFFKTEIDFESCDFSVMFCHQSLFKNFKLKVGSKVILYSQLRDTSSVDSIIILTKSVYLNDVEEMLKYYLAKNCKQGPVLLNADFPFQLDDKNMVCALKFEPSSKSYCILDSDNIRKIKYTVVEKEVEIIRNESEEQFITFNELDVCTEVGNYRQIFENVCNILQKSLNRNSYELEGIVISGKSGSGKTTLLNLIKNKLSDSPFRLHFEIVNCGTLKGKTLDSLSRMLYCNIVRAIYFQPSVILLDDLNAICGKVEREIQTQESVVVNRSSEIVRDLLNIYLTHNQIQVIATCENITQINEYILPARGKRVLWHPFKIEDLNQSDRLSLLRFLFSNKTNLDVVDLEKYTSQMDGFVVQDLVDFTNKAIFESIKEGCSQVSSIHCDNVFSNFSPVSLQNINTHSFGDKDFSDVGGLEDVKTILIESLLWPLQYPHLFASAPLRLQTGVLLYGPPGTGKTLVAGAAAKHCNLRLIAIKGPELLSKYIGASEQAVRQIFEKAQSAKPCILFFDEFDSFAPRRGHDSTGVTDRVVNQLLTQLDGVESLSGVCVLAATSRPDLLDPALLRPGRLDKQIFCPFPDSAARLAILKALSKSVKFANNVNLSEIANLAENYSGADLQGVLCTAHLAAVEEAMGHDKELKEDPEITQEHLKDAIVNSRPSLSRDERAKYERIYKKFEGSPNKLDLLGAVQKATLA